MRVATTTASGPVALLARPASNPKNSHTQWTKPWGPVTWDSSASVPLMLTDASTNYIYDDNGNPVEQIDATGVALYYQHDQYGSTRLMTSQAGTVAATFTYNAYGALTAHTGTSDTPLRWNGQYQDTDTGLYYLRARYYDPTTAQFLTRDPLVALTLDAYGFGGGSPLNLGAAGAVAGIPGAVGAGLVWGGLIAESSTAEAILGGVGAFGWNLGIGGTAIDLGATFGTRKQPCAGGGR